MDSLKWIKITYFKIWFDEEALKTVHSFSLNHDEYLNGK